MKKREAPISSQDNEVNREKLVFFDFFSRLVETSANRMDWVLDYFKNDKVGIHDSVSGSVTKEPSSQGGRSKAFKEWAGATFSALALAFAFGSVGVETLKKIYQYKVTAKSGPDGKTLYEHEDPETTRNIDRITGVRKLSYEEKVSLMRNDVEYLVQHYASGLDKKLVEVIKQRASPQDGSIQAEDWEIREVAQDIATDILSVLPKKVEDVQNMSTEELFNALKKFYFYFDGAVQNYADVNEFLDEFYDTPYSPDLKEKLYSAVWKLETENGSPRVRILPNSSVELEDQNFWWGLRSYFDPTTNTIYLQWSPHKLDSLLAELAHSHQFKNGSASAFFDASASDFFTTLVRSLSNGITPNMAQKELYGQSGSVEHEAHQVIQPKFRTTLPDGALPRIQR